MTDNICPLCGFTLGTEVTDELVLPYFERLGGRFVTGRVLGQGGFGITYLGYDEHFGDRVAIKEYYPASFATRMLGDETHTVHPFRSQRDKTEFFNKGLGRFQTEAKRLLKFAKSPGFVGVRDIFAERGTAYIVMEFIDGDPLSDVFRKSEGKIGEKSMLELLLPIIKILEKMHNAGIIHRDIAPDNIMVQREDGTAVLIDLGSSIELTEEGKGDNKSTVALVKNGYAADELYDLDHSRQGTWSDVYSICATMYRTLTGKKPPDAIDRQRGAKLPPILENVSEQVKNAIYHGMAVKIEDRTKTMGELIKELTAVGAANENSIRPQPAPESVRAASRRSEDLNETTAPNVMYGKKRGEDYNYRGQFVDGKYSGLGIIAYDDGDVIIGQFEGGRQVGYSLYLYADGDVEFCKIERGNVEVIEKINGLKINNDIFYK
jgi:serine/threonine protein kinase